MANHSKVSPPWILSQIVAYSSFLHRCLHELNVLFRKNELKNLMKSPYNDHAHRLLHPFHCKEVTISMIQDWTTFLDSWPDSSNVFFKRAKGMKKTHFQMLKFDKDLCMQPEAPTIVNKVIIFYGLADRRNSPRVPDSGSRATPANIFTISVKRQARTT